MQVSTTPVQRFSTPKQAAAPQGEPAAAAPADKFDPQTMKKAFKKPYEAWVPLANAGIVGGAIGGASALGALEHQLLGAELASGITAVVTPLVAGLGVGYWAGKSAAKEFNGHPVLVGMSALFAGGAAAVAAPFLKMPGAAFGWTGALVAAGVGAVGAGVITAVGIHKANEKIEHHNKLFAEWQKENPPTPEQK